MNKLMLADVMNTEVGGFTLGHIIKAIIAFILCIAAVKIITKALGKTFRKTHIPQNTSDIIIKVLRVVMYVITAVTVAAVLGIDMSSLVAVVSVVSLGVTIAAEDILGNMAGGLVARSGNVFDIGDYVSIGGHEGFVTSVTMNHTRLKTFDGTTEVIPNKLISSQYLTNYTQNGTRRVNIYLDIEYGTPAEKVRKSALRAVDSIGMAMDDPEPKLRLWEFKESSLYYYLCFWVTADRYYDAIYAVNESIQKCFEEDGIQFTYNHMNVHLMED